MIWLAIAAFSLKESFLWTLKHPGHSNQKVHGRTAHGDARLAGRELRNLRVQPGDSKINAKVYAKAGRKLLKSPKNEGVTDRLARGLGKAGGGTTRALIQEATINHPAVKVAKLFGKGIRASAHKYGKIAEGFIQGIAGKEYDAFEYELPTQVTIKAQDDGKYRFTIVATGAFQDKDNEVVSLKAITDWVEMYDAGKAVPVVYRWWHMGMPDVSTKSHGTGFDLGTVDFAGVHNKHLILSGLFNDNEVGQAFSEKEAELGSSLGFFHPITQPDHEGVFNYILPFEVSALPKERASYQFTESVITKE